MTWRDKNQSLYNLNIISGTFRVIVSWSFWESSVHQNSTPHRPFFFFFSSSSWRSKIVTPSTPCLFNLLNVFRTSIRLLQMSQLPSFSDLSVLVVYRKQRYFCFTKLNDVFRITSISTTYQGVFSKTIILSKHDYPRYSEIWGTYINRQNYLSVKMMSSFISKLSTEQSFVSLSGRTCPPYATHYNRKTIITNYCRNQHYFYFMSNETFVI